MGTPSEFDTDSVSCSRQFRFRSCHQRADRIRASSPLRATSSDATIEVESADRQEKQANIS